MDAPQRKLSDIRNEYMLRELDEKNIRKNPLEQLQIWLDEAIESKVCEPTAMDLATVSGEGKPSLRVVLLKGIEDGLVFFTNYLSRKGKQITENPHAAINFFWAELERQVRVEGKIVKVSKVESEIYFKSRPEMSRIGAHVSRQSEKLASRKQLEDAMKAKSKEFEGKDIPLPNYWGGYKLIPEYFEFWQGRPSRLHDRIYFELIDGKWEMGRLMP
ncbi:MAG: pyridoxamine 5'-phosphate oxidase [Cytophagaceae bacterium]